MSGRVVVYGGRGALGSDIVTRFKQSGWWVANIDIKANTDADENVLVEGDSWQCQEQSVASGVASVIGEAKLDAVICVAGGWAGGSPASKEFIKNSEAMWRSSVWPASISASLATSHLKQGGMVILPGAAPAVAGTPGMVGYGMAKVKLKSDHVEKETVMKNNNKGSRAPLDKESGLLRVWAPRQLPGRRHPPRHPGHAYEQEVDGEG